MSKQIIVNVVLSADGTLDTEKTDAAYFALRDKLAGQVAEDFNTVAVDITAFLLQHPALKTIPTTALTRSLWEAKAEAGLLKGKSQEEKQAMFTRLEEVVPEYVRQNPDMFHIGRKTGIAIRYVMGEQAVNAKGEKQFDPSGEPVQAYRHTDEEWKKLTTPKAKETEGNGAAAAA